MYNNKIFIMQDIIFLGFGFIAYNIIKYNNTHNILNTIAVFTKYSLTLKLLVIKYWLKKSINIKYIPS